MRGAAAMIAVGLAIGVIAGAGGRTPPAAHADGQVGERPVLDNERVTVVEYTFPAGFRGDEHAAFANEFAYVLEGEFTVVTQGRGKRVVRPGEVEYASKGTIHTSLNETRKPARVLVVVLKDR